MFNDGPKTVTYALPGGLALFLAWVVWVLPADHSKVAMLALLFAVLFGVIAATNWWKLWSKHRQELFSERQTALSVTPLVLLSQNMKQMHPEAVKVLNRFGVRATWQVKVNKNDGTRDWILMGTDCHFGFIEHVLSRSNGTLYPRWKLVEGSKKWDPDGLIEDREQHRQLETWLFSNLMVTRAHGEFKPAEFMPPWTPEAVMDVMGLTGEQDLYRPDEDMKSSAVSGQRAGKAMADHMKNTLSDLEQTASMRPATK